MDGQQNISYVHAVCRRAANEKIEALKTDAVVNIHSEDINYSNLWDQLLRIWQH